MTNSVYVNRGKIVITKSLIIISYDFIYYLRFRSLRYNYDKHDWLKKWV